MSSIAKINDLTIKITSGQITVVILSVFLAIVLTVLINTGNNEFAGVVFACCVISFFYKKLETLFCFWLAVSPLADYLVRYPEQQSVITFARLIVMLLGFGVVAQLIKNKENKFGLGLFELSWGLFAFYALGDCLLHTNFSLSTLRTALDGFFLPLVLFAIVRQGLELEKVSNKIFGGLIIFSYVVFLVGVYELIVGVDLMAYPGGQLIFDGRVRPNGPFLSDHSYALISLMAGLTLLYWPKVAVTGIEKKYKKFWQTAVLSAFGAALIPQFRAVMLVMIICLIVGRGLVLGWRSLITPILLGMLILLAATPVWLVLKDTNFYQQRIADSANFSSRVMTYKKALEVAQSNLIGVGLGNYENYFNQRWAIKEQPEKEKLGELAQSTPHNNFLSVLAELGLIGFLLYLLAHLVLIYTSWQFIKCSGHTKIAGVTTLLLIIAYTGVGFTLTSGYYYDLNLFFFACIGILLGRGKQSGVLTS